MRIRYPSGRPGPATCRPGGLAANLVLAVPRLGALQAARPHRPWHGFYTCLLVAVAALCVAPPAEAQAGPPASGAGEAAMIQAMTGDLRRMVSANEVYKAKNKRYAAAVADLTTYRASSGVTVVITAVTATGWSGKATASSLPGKSCVISVGTVATAPKTDATGRTGADAVVVCDPA
jgi:hypothetical protein